MEHIAMFDENAESSIVQGFTRTSDGSCARCDSTAGSISFALGVVVVFSVSANCLAPRFAAARSLGRCA